MPRFKVVTNPDEIDPYWPVAWTGQGDDFNIYHIVSEQRRLPLPNEAAMMAHIIAKLLNWYYADPTTAEQVIKGEISEL